MKKLAVVGLGNMGFNHVRTIHQMHNTELSIVVDSNRLRAEEVARDYNTTPAINIKDIDPENTDGVVIAAPSHLHGEIGNELLDRGLHVLVEKPISLEIAEAEQLAEKAREIGRVLMVGHTELFNPAVRVLYKVLGETAIKSMRFKRLGAVLDESRLYHNAVHDLMVHDIAVAMRLMDKTEDDAQVIFATGRQDTAASPDPAEAYLRFHTGEDVHFRASRAYTGGKIRSLEVETEDYVILADMLEHKVEQIVAGEGRYLGDALFSQGKSVATHYPQKTAEPLELELNHFVGSIEGTVKPEDEYVSAKDGIRVMRIAEDILKAIELSGDS